MPVAIGYLRVSTEAQASTGVSLEAQEQRIRAWCVANGYELVGMHRDAGISGKAAGNRPGLRAALDDACRRKAALVVYSLSRLARSTRDALDISTRLDRAGSDLVSLSERLDTTTAAGKMLFRLMSVLAEFEADLIAERTTTALAHMRSQNQRISGHVPFGFDLSADGSSLIAVPAEQAVIERIGAMHATGTSLRRIAAALNAQGVAPKRAAKWSASGVQAVLRRQRK